MNDLLSRGKLNPAIYFWLMALLVLPIQGIFAQDLPLEDVPYDERPAALRPLQNICISADGVMSWDPLDFHRLDVYCISATKEVYEDSTVLEFPGISTCIPTTSGNLIRLFQQRSENRIATELYGVQVQAEFSVSHKFAYILGFHSQGP